MTLNKSLRRWVAAVVLMILGRSGPAGAAPPTWPDVRGLYVYTLGDAITKAPGTNPGDAVEITQALGVAGVDGLALVEDWSAIEPAHGVFQWDGVPAGSSLFDQWIAQAAGHGQKINLIIRAGRATPCWLFNASDGLCAASYGGSYAGARAWAFQASAHQGQGSCDAIHIPTPWDLVFLYEWDRMLAAVAAHLRAIGAYDAVQLVRLTGLNRTTDEFRLPEEILSTTGCQTNSISTWLNAGYRPGLMLVAWDVLTYSFGRNFPGKLFSVPIIPIDSGAGQYPFPEIDGAGCVFTSIVPATTWTVPAPIPPGTCTNTVDRATADGQLNLVLFVALAIADGRFPGQLAVEFENLTTGVPANATIVAASDVLGTKLAFQTNDFGAADGSGAGAECGPLGGGVACTAQTYLNLLDEGIYPCQDLSKDAFCASTTVRATFIEVFAGDVLAYSSSTPDAIGTAHLELVAAGP
jgi:hypothetical protein